MLASATNVRGGNQVETHEFEGYRISDLDALLGARRVGVPDDVRIDEFDSYIDGTTTAEDSAVYDIRFTQITPDNDNVLESNLDAITQALFDNHDVITEGAETGKVDIDQTENVVYASHPVYRAQITQDGVDIDDIVIKFGDSDREIEAYQFFEEQDGIRSLTPVFNTTVTINDSVTNVIATEYLEGQDYTEVDRNDPEFFAKYKDAVRQITRVEERGRSLEGLQNVVEDDEKYFTNRLEKVFFNQFKGIAEEWLSPRALKKIEKLQERILANYDFVNSRLVEDSLKNGVMYVDGGRMNIRDTGEGAYVADLAGGRALTSMGVTSLMAYGRKEITEEDLKKGDLEDFTAEEKTNLYDIALLESAAENANEAVRRQIYGLIKSRDDVHNDVRFNRFVSEEDRENAHVLNKYKSVHRRWLYSGYDERDIDNVSLADKRNAFNKQRAHIRTAIRDLKEILKSDRDMTREERRSAKAVLKDFKRISNIIEGHEIEDDVLYQAVDEVEETPVMNYDNVVESYNTVN